MNKNHWSWKLALAAGGVLLVGLAAYNYCTRYCHGPVHLTLGGGNTCPLRSEMAQRIRSEVRRYGVDVEPVDDPNSDSVAADVNAHRVDLGLVLGGFPPNAHRNVRQAATLGVEPLHLLVPPELLAGTAPSLKLLRGRRVSLGERHQRRQARRRPAPLRRPAALLRQAPRRL